jgi:hypothetical protein
MPPRHPGARVVKPQAPEACGIQEVHLQLGRCHPQQPNNHRGSGEPSPRSGPTPGGPRIEAKDLDAPPRLAAESVLDLTDRGGHRPAGTPRRRRRHPGTHPGLAHPHHPAGAAPALRLLPSPAELSVLVGVSPFWGNTLRQGIRDRVQVDASGGTGRRSHVGVDSLVWRTVVGSA